MAKRYELNDQQWARIAEMLPGKKSDPGRTAKDNRLFVNGVLWVLRSGAQWDELPERYGKWKSIHKRFTRWAENGVWERVFAVLIDDPKKEIKRLYKDGQIVPIIIKELLDKSGHEVVPG